MRMACLPAFTSLNLNGVVPTWRPSTTTAAPCGRDSTINVPIFDDNFGDFDFDGGFTRGLAAFATRFAGAVGAIAGSSGTGVGTTGFGAGAGSAVTSVNSLPAGGVAVAVTVGAITRSRIATM